MTLIKRNIPAWPSITDFFDDDWIRNRFNNSWTPAVNVVETDIGYEIEVAAPGLKKEDFTVTVENGMLFISGKTEKEEEEKEKNYTRKEFSSRSFTKSFTLPENVEDDEVNAWYEDGILHLALRKVELELPAKREVVIK